MEREIIERLAMDSVAEELNEDMQVLFDTYLAEHAEANQWAEDISQIFKLTETTIQTKTRTVPAEIKAPVKAGHLWRLNWQQIVRWAAVVALAACIGLVVGRFTKSPELIQRPERTVASSTGTTGQSLRDSGDAGEGFWKDKALAMLSAGPQHLQGGFDDGEGLWNKYREYIKEKDYE